MSNESEMVFEGDIEDFEDVYIVNSSFNQPESQQTRSQTTQPSEAAWTHNATLVLIDQYKKYRDKVGSLSIPNMKKMWKVIAADIENLQGMIFTPAQVENRWRVVDRNYKKFVDNNNRTGRGRRHFEFAKEMEEIFAKKTNIHPEVLLSTATITTHSIVERPSDTPSTSKVQHLEDVMAVEVDTPSTKIAESLKDTPTRKRKRTTLQKGNYLEIMQHDRKEYYKENLEIKRQRLLLEKEKLKILEERNTLIKKRNQILQQYLDNNINLPSDLK